MSDLTSEYKKDQCHLGIRVLYVDVDLATRVTELASDLFAHRCLLGYLMRHADRVVTRTMLLERVWDFHFDPETNIVETHVRPVAGQALQRWA